MKKEIGFLSSKLNSSIYIYIYIYFFGNLGDEPQKIVEFFQTCRTYFEKDIKSQNNKKKWISSFNQSIKKKIDSFAVTAS